MADKRALAGFPIDYDEATADGRLPVSMPGTGSIATGQVALSTSAALVAAARVGRTRAVVKNYDTAITVYLGASGVLSTTGLELKPGESFATYSEAAIYAVAASGTPTVGYLEEYG